MPLPLLYAVRHGETAWSLSGQHTGISDIPLTPAGERQAAALARRLDNLEIEAVFTSPLQRAARTCELAGFGSAARVDADLVEWNYGEYDGKTSAEIRAVRPGWRLFVDGCPGGETIERVCDRADRFIARVRCVSGNCLAFTSGHFSRVLAARWLGLPPDAGRFFVVGVTSLGVLGYDHSLDEPVIRSWNESCGGN